MIFDNDDERISNEEILLITKPNLIFSSKKIILAFILFAFVLGSASPIIGYIANMQIYMIGYVKAPITSYVVIAIFVLALLILVWIIFQLLGWYFTEYVITNVRIITKSGFIRKNKSYMGYKNIQDIKVSQSIIGRLFKVGTVSIYSAYDKTDVELKYIRNPKNIEEILFTEMNKIPQDMYYYQQSQNIPQYYPPNTPNQEYYDNQNPNYYDDEAIYPIHNQEEYNPKRYDKDVVSYDDLNQQLDNELYYNDFDDSDFKTMEEDIKTYNGNLKFQPRNESSIKKSYSNDHEVYNPYTEFENELINEEIGGGYPVYSNKKDKYHSPKEYDYPPNQRDEYNYSSHDDEYNHYQRGNEYPRENQYSHNRHSKHHKDYYNNRNSQKPTYPNEQYSRDYYGENQYSKEHYSQRDNSHYQQNSQHKKPYYPQSENQYQNSHDNQENKNHKKTEELKKDKKSVLAKHAQKFKKD